MKPHLDALNTDFADTKVPEHPLWLLRKPSVVRQLMELGKPGTHPIEYQRLHAVIQGQLEGHLSICTDCSKEQGLIVVVAVCWQLNFGVHIPDQS